MSAAIVPERFQGLFRFPGAFAFLERDGNPDALLQIDQPFTGVFNLETAHQTNDRLQAVHADGDPAVLSGKILACNVNGIVRPVLFMFG